MASKRGGKVNFLKQFHDERSLQLRKLSAVQFSEVWMHYDKDGKNNYIRGAKSIYNSNTLRLNPQPPTPHKKIS